MIDHNSELSNQDKDTVEFIEKLSNLVFDYRKKLPMGVIIGAMETIKLRLFNEGLAAMDQEFKEKGIE